MKKLFGTSALVMALAVPAFAQDATAPAAPMGKATMSSPYLEGVERGVRASDFIGKRVYVTEQDTSALSLDAIAAADTNWDDAGEISDLIISLNGDGEAVLVDFGGFLGIGEKTVAVSMANLVMVPDSNSPDDYFIVFHGNKDQLQSAPQFNPDMVFAASDATMTTGGNTMADGVTATGNAMTDTAAAGAAAVEGAADRGMDETVNLAVMTETDLMGKRVYGPNEEDVGEISAVALDADSKIMGAVVDVGGFLGMGEKRVALDSSMLRLVRDSDGSGTHFRVSMTQEQLKALPTYEG
ncbi:MAG: PRC-barrel domain-containing protein [Paracoccaceae bacterium]